MYKSIIVSMNDKNRSASLLSVAGQIASRHQAHVIGLFVVPQLDVPVAASIHFTPEVCQIQDKYYNDSIATQKALFEEYVRKQGLSGEWRDVKSVNSVVADTFMDHARQADLVVIGQPGSSETYSLEADFAERVVIETGRPVLVVPHDGAFDNVGHRVIIGWNASREAARAAFDALPLLTGAEQVSVVWIDPQADREHAGTAPGAECATALARHGVKVETSPLPTSGIGAGDALLNQVSDLGADLLVMGAYGHSRLREFIFSGASRTMFQNMTVPVLMSH